MENNNDVKRMKLEKEKLEKELEDLIIDRHDKMVENLTMETIDKVFKTVSKVKRIYLKINNVVTVITTLYGVISVNVLFLLLGGLEILMQKRIEKSLKEDYETIKTDHYEEVKNQIWNPNWNLVEEFIEDRCEDKEMAEYNLKIKDINSQIRILESNIEIWNRMQTNENKHRYKYDFEEEEQEVVIENNLKK